MASKQEVNTRRVRPGLNNEFRLNANEFGFISAGVSDVGGYK